MNIFKVILILTLIGMVFTTLCYTLPGWMLFETENMMVNVQFGLWYYKACLEKQDCITISLRDAVEKTKTKISDADHFGEEEESIGTGLVNLMYAGFVVYQIEMTLSLVSGLVGLAVCYQIFKHGHLQQGRYSYLRTLVAIGLVANLIAAVLILLPMGRFANELWHYYQLHAIRKIKFGFPYALLLGGIGGLCFLISTLLLILSLIRKQYQGEVMQLTTQQIPMVIIQTGAMDQQTEGGYYPVREPPPYDLPPNYPGVQGYLTQDQAPMLPQKQRI